MHLPPPLDGPPVLVKIALFTGDAFKKLDVGLTREQVLTIVGRPDGVDRNGAVEILTYRNRMMSGWGWDRADYYVVLTDGRVTSYGTGAVRERDAPVIVVPSAPASVFAPAPAPLPPIGGPSGAAAPTASDGGMCAQVREWTSGSYKNCVYNCLGGEVVQTVKSLEMCPLTIQR